MSRCISCNRILVEGELLQTKSDGSPEDLCNVCRPKCYEESSIFEHEYHHSNIQSGLLQPTFIKD